MHFIIFIHDVASDMYFDKFMMLAQNTNIKSCNLCL